MIENYLNTKKKATFGLILVTLIWGLTFIWMDWAIEVAKEAEPNLSHQTLASSFVFFRFLIASILLIPFITNVKDAFLDKKIRNGGIWLGILVWAGFFFQMIGIAYPDVTPAVSAFLTSLYVIFTAIIGLVLGRQKLTFFMGMGVLLATFGAGWISGPPQLNFNLPEWLTVIGAFMFAAHIIATDRLTQDRDTTHLTVVMLCTVATVSLFILPFFVKFGEFDNIARLLLLPGYFIPLICCAIFGSLVALLLLTILQKHLSPVRAAILYALEPVWASIFSLMLGREGDVTFWLFLGGGALIIGNLIVEFSNFKKNYSPNKEIERRFLLDSLPKNIGTGNLIEQVYLPLEKLIFTNEELFYETKKVTNFPNELNRELKPLIENNEKNIICRIRKQNKKNIFTIKIRDSPGIRREWEWEIKDENKELNFSNLPKVIKKRYELLEDGLLWEIDEFLGNNEGLIIAEIELDSLDFNFTLPSWIGKEITGEISYLNSSLAERD
ncbi:MAG: EamA family transporter [Candidatus Thermoplasmatota archaeon]|nr:EamA family transporter [Candidatus Thermoplasmatota archaeon]